MKNKPACGYLEPSGLGKPLLIQVCLLWLVGIEAGWSQDGEKPEFGVAEFNQILGEADAACAELVKFNKTQEASPFSFEQATTLSRVYNTYVIGNRLDEALKVLELDFDTSMARFLLETTAVQFGAAIPERTEFANVNEEYRWKLSLLISLADGERYSEAEKVIDTFPKQQQTPKIRLNCLIIIAKKSLDAGHEQTCRLISSRIYQLLKSLDEEDYSLRISYWVKLVNLSVRFASLKPARVLVEQADPLLDDRILEIEKIERFGTLLSFGKANALVGRFAESSKLFDRAQMLIGEIDDEFFEHEKESSRLELAKAVMFEKMKKLDRAKDHAAKSLEHLGRIDETKRIEQAGSLDGGQGLFSTAFKLSRGSDYVDLILWHEKVGNKKESQRIWESMPLSYQKLLCQMKLAKHYTELNQNDSAAKCGDRCLQLIDQDTSKESLISIKIAAAHIFQDCGKLLERDRIVKELLDEAQIMDSDPLKQTLASELAELGLLRTAYSLCQKIESIHQRANPLSRIVFRHAKSQKR